MSAPGTPASRLLSEMQFDVVKIDLSLVQAGTAHDPSHAILRALQELAAQWKASVVAEGIETAEQLAVVRDLGISAGQGYLLGRPGKEPVAEPIDLDGLRARTISRSCRSSIASTSDRTAATTVAAEGGAALDWVERAPAVPERQLR